MAEHRCYICKQLIHNADFVFVIRHDVDGLQIVHHRHRGFDAHPELRAYPDLLAGLMLDDILEGLRNEQE